VGVAAALVDAIAAVGVAVGEPGTGS
jgi:hypothetical protein